MTNRKIQFVEGEYYHIYNRGNSKQKIFLDEEDYKRFVQLLYVCNSENNFKFRDNIVYVKIDAFDFDRGETLVDICAYVLMPNHFHLYVTPNSHRSDLWKNKQNKDISNFMKKLGTAYSMYFNKKYKRSGGLFEGKFKSVHVSTNKQAKYLFSYIHLNPLKLIDKEWKKNTHTKNKKFLNFLNLYKWGSYLDYKNSERIESLIIDKKFFSENFNSIKDFDTEMSDWITEEK